MTNVIGKGGRRREGSKEKRRKGKEGGVQKESWERRVKKEGGREGKRKQRKEEGGKVIKREEGREKG